MAPLSLKDSKSKSPWPRITARQKREREREQHRIQGAGAGRGARASATARNCAPEGAASPALSAKESPDFGSLGLGSMRQIDDELSNTHSNTRLLFLVLLLPFDSKSPPPPNPSAPFPRSRDNKAALLPLLAGGEGRAERKRNRAATPGPTHGFAASRGGPFLTGCRAGAGGRRIPRVSFFERRAGGGTRATRARREAAAARFSPSGAGRQAGACCDNATELGSLPPAPMGEKRNSGAEGGRRGADGGGGGGGGEGALGAPAAAAAAPGPSAAPPGRLGKMPVGRQTPDDVSKSSSEPDPSWLC
jgi:hypothetical protein